MSGVVRELAGKLVSRRVTGLWVSEAVGDGPAKFSFIFDDDAAGAPPVFDAGRTVPIKKLGAVVVDNWFVEQEIFEAKPADVANHHVAGDQKRAGIFFEDVTHAREAYFQARHLRLPIHGRSCSSFGDRLDAAGMKFDQEIDRQRR